MCVCGQNTRAGRHHGCLRRRRMIQWSLFLSSLQTHQMDDNGRFYTAHWMSDKGGEPPSPSPLRIFSAFCMTLPFHAHVSSCSRVSWGTCRRVMATIQGRSERNTESPGLGHQPKHHKTVVLRMKSAVHVKVPICAACCDFCDDNM